MYRLLKPILFTFYPETAHKIVVMLLTILRYIPFSQTILRAIYCRKTPHLEREIFGLKFKNPVGLAGGFDKNGEYYNDMANFGFSFVEIGSISPLPQDGNPKPRLYRLVEDEALINRMGLNDNGVKQVVENLKKRKPDIIVAANITKDNTTSLENAAADYEKVFSLIYDFVDMFVLNISCPNVTGLGKLQNVDHLASIIDRVLSMRRYFDDYKPILLKLSPDIARESLDDIIELALLSGIDGIVATNTTTSREGLKTAQSQLDAIGNGGLSGAPLYERSKEMVKYIHTKSKGLLPVIACGGIMSPRQAAEMLEAGASLVEIYTGFIYRGPAIVKKIVTALEKDAIEKSQKNA